MKTMFRAALMVAAFIFILPLSARAEIKAGSVELSPFAGYTFFEHRQNLENRPVFGGRLGYNFTRHFGMEGVVEFTHTRVDDSSRTGIEEGQYRSPMGDVDILFYHLDAVYHFMPEGRFNPFVLAGFGLAHYDPDIADKDMSAFNVGVGAKYWMSDNFAFRVDIRDYMVNEVFRWNYHNVGATVGVTFAFGGKSTTESKAVTETKPESKPVSETKPESTPITETRPESKAVTPAPMAEKPVVIIVAEPRVEEKVKVLAAEPQIEEMVIVFALEDIHFDFDKSTLKPEAKAILKRNLLILKKNPKAKVRIAGYTSASGTGQYNQRLSDRRASAVMDYLVKEGVTTPERLSEIGYGETNPEAYEAAPKDIYSDAAKANMRVLFEIILK